MSIDRINEISNTIINNLRKVNNLKNYRQLVQQANDLGEYLWKSGLNTKIIYQFLEQANKFNSIFPKKPEDFHKKIKPQLPLIQKELIKAANQHEIIQAPKQVIELAITKVTDITDYEYLVQLIELTFGLEKAIVRNLKTKSDELKEYSVRQLIKDAEELAYYLQKQDLKTNQIRKFLDTVNRIKIEISVKTKERESNSEVILLKELPKIDTQVILLKQKLAYAVARETSVKPLKEVMDVAIDQVHDTDDFERLFQLIESIIAYHKVFGGKD